MARPRIRLSETLRRLNPHIDADQPAGATPRPPQKRKRRAGAERQPTKARLIQGGTALGEFCISFAGALKNTLVNSANPASRKSTRRF